VMTFGCALQRLLCWSRWSTQTRLRSNRQDRGKAPRYFPDLPHRKPHTPPDAAPFSFISQSKRGQGNLSTANTARHHRRAVFVSSRSDHHDIDWRAIGTGFDHRAGRGSDTPTGPAVEAAGRSPGRVPRADQRTNDPAERAVVVYNRDTRFRGYFGVFHVHAETPKTPRNTAFSACFDFATAAIMSPLL
jgi:hypothetical protein